MPTRHLPPWRVRSALAALALIAATRSIGYAIPGRDVQDPLILASLDGALLPVWVAVWGAGALLCLWDMRRPTLRGWGPVVVVGMLTAWAAAYTVGQVVAVTRGDWPLWWQTAALYGGMAVAVVTLIAPVGVIIRPRRHRRTGGARA